MTAARFVRGRLHRNRVELVVVAFEVATSGDLDQASSALTRIGHDVQIGTSIEAELRKAEERLAQARKEYANGEPVKQGIESRNYQRYLDRVAELKAAVARAESDVAGLQRELGRLPASANAVGSAAK